MGNHQKHLVSFCAAIALCLIGWGARTEGKKAPIQIGAIHNLTGALGSIGAPSLDAWGCAARREPRGMRANPSRSSDEGAKS